MRRRLALLTLAFLWPTLAAAAGSVVDVTDPQFGAMDGDAILDTAAIISAIDSLPSSGGTVLLPCEHGGEYRIDATLTAGSGARGVQSTKHNVTLKGCGLASNYLTEMSLGGVAGTRILWYGPAGGTMVKFAGPISGGGLSDLALDGAATGNVAATLVEAFHHVRARYENLTLQGYSGIGVRIGASHFFPGMVIGGDDGIWTNVKVNGPANASATAMEIGEATWITGQMSVSRNVFSNLYLKGGNGPAGRGLVLRFADNDTFVRPFIEAGSFPLEIAPPPGATDFPMAISFYDAVVTGNLTVTGEWTSTTGIRGLTFWPWITTDGGSVPSHPKIRGIDDQGNVFGGFAFSRLGIGTGAPETMLHVYGESGADVFAGFGPNPDGIGSGPALNIGYAGTSYGRGAGFLNVRPDAGATPPNPSLRFATGNVIRMVIDNEGFLGLGVTNPTHPIELASGAHVTAGGIWTNASSRELKQDIAELSAGEAAEVLAELSPVKFAYRAAPAERHVGFIAEDVPDLLATADRRGLSALDIVAVLTKVVQEQQRSIAALEARCAE